MTTLSKGVNFLLQSQRRISVLPHPFESATISGMSYMNSFYNETSQIHINLISGQLQMPLALRPLEEQPTLSAAVRQSSGGQGTHQVLQGVPVTAQVPSAALDQTVTSTIASHQSIGGQGAHQVTQGTSISAKATPILSSLEESSEGDLLSHSQLTQIFMKSCSRKNMAVLMTRQLFSPEVRMSSNVSGRKKKQLDPKIIHFIRRKAFLFFSLCSLGYFQRMV